MRQAESNRPIQSRSLQPNRRLENFFFLSCPTATAHLGPRRPNATGRTLRLLTPPPVRTTTTATTAASLLGRSSPQAPREARLILRPLLPHLGQTPAP